MKALLLSNLYPSRREPTRGTFNHQLFGALSHFCDVRVIAPLPWWSRVRHPSEWFATPHEDHTGLDVLLPTYWSLPRVVPLHGIALYTSLRRQVAELRRTFAFEVVLAAWAYPDAVAASMLAEEFDCPLVTQVLGSDINEIAQHGALGAQIQRALSRSHAVISVSEALKQRVVDLGVAPERVIVRHNGVDGERFAVRDRTEARRELGLPEDKKLIVYVGNFKPEKGVDTLVEAVGQPALADRDVELVLVGSGPLEKTLRATASSLGVARKIRFAGRQPHDAIPEWISGCDVFCLPSRHEGCPNVVLEALACGRPVVASAVGGVPELLHEGQNGHLVPASTPLALATALGSALDRAWDPQALRGTVESLSWIDAADAVHRVLVSAIREHDQAAAAAPAEEPLRGSIAA